MEKLVVSMTYASEPKKSVGKIRDKQMILSYIAIRRQDGKAVFTVRFYQGRGEYVYCLVWVHSENRYFRGVGRAGGYGYEKKSAAFEDAMYDMGATFSRSISGAGESYIKEAIQSACHDLGEAVWIVDAHA